MSLSSYLALFIVHVTAVAIPGPSSFYFITHPFITQTAFKYGKRNALMATLGATLGVTVWITITLAGLIVLLRHNALLHRLLTLADSFYLLWMVQSILRGAWASSRSKHRDDLRVADEPDMLQLDRGLRYPPAS